MTDDSIEAKALALVNEVNVERGYAPYSKFDRDFDHTSEALCRAVEQHEAFRQEVSDAVVSEYLHAEYAPERMQAFIIPKPKPDPLVEVLKKMGWYTPAYAENFRDELEARGLEIREKNDDN
jgi:hypothetical protein